MSDTCTSRSPRGVRTGYSSSRPHEADQQLREVIDQRRIGDAEPRVEGVLRQPGKEATQNLGTIVGTHRQLPPRAALPLREGTCPSVAAQ